MARASFKNEALNLPCGARFYRCALQVNPHHYMSTYRGKGHEFNEEEYVKALIDKCTEMNIEIIAITDHNHVGSIDMFRDEAKKHGISVFPGFEIASSEGVHVLCIYPLEASIDTLSRYLGECGIRDTDPSSKLSNMSFNELLGRIIDQGGITIGAHVTQDKGLLHILHGNARINAWKDNNLLAVQIPGPIDSVPDDKRAFIKNHNLDYKRYPGAGDNLALAVVNAKDVAKPEDLADESTWSWIKISEISVEGLRQAFLDPDSRIRLASDPIPEEHEEFISLSWQGGFLDGASIHFNENLNVLIGGRGTGKSTVVESLRYVLGLEPVGEEANKSHGGIIKHVLRNGTKISLAVRTYRPSQRDYLIERTIPNPPVLRDGSGSVLSLLPCDVMPKVEVYGQHEISELTKSREKLTLLLERFVEHDSSLGQRKGDSLNKLEASRSRILELQREQNRIAEQLGSLPALEETLRRFQEAGIEERLKEQSLLVKEEKVLRTAAERIDSFRGVLQQLRKLVPVDRSFLSSEAMKELPGKEILVRDDPVLSKFDDAVQKIIADLEAAIKAAEDGMGSVKSKWQDRESVVNEQYEKILRDLQKSKVDGEEFIQLLRQIEELHPLRDRKESIIKDIDDYFAQRRTHLAEWEDVKTQEFRELESAAKRVNGKLNDRVKVSVTFLGNRKPLCDLLRNEVGGRLAEAIEVLERRDDLSLQELARTTRSGKDALSEKYGIAPLQAARIAQADPNVVLKIEELDLSSTTRIELNVAPEGETPQWQTLEELSTGQKATAVLLLLLLESDAPLVVDQPEDDLDNRFITEGIVPRMKEEKRRRQFIFTTHNANIPVLGDAELIVGLTASGEGGQGKAKMPKEHMGAIDVLLVRELVEELLEGGKDAFEMRRKKYGF